jgi:hypothetical protein
LEVKRTRPPKASAGHRSDHRDERTAASFDHLSAVPSRGDDRGENITPQNASLWPEAPVAVTCRILDGYAAGLAHFAKVNAVVQPLGLAEDGFEGVSYQTQSAN